MASTSQPAVKYRVCEVDIKASRMLYVLHGRGGSSALATIANAVLSCDLESCDLGRALSTEGGARGRPKYIKVETLQNIIELALVKRLDEFRRKQTLDAASMLQFWNMQRKAIQLLPKCLSVNPLLESCDAFAGTDMLKSMCDTLGHSLYHGLVVTPEDAEAIRPKSYNEIIKMLPSEVENNPAIKKFLENSKDGLTTFGLRQLKDRMRESEVVVLFRNDQFSFVVKADGNLFELVSNEEQVKKTPNAMWRLLEEVREKGKLLDSGFAEIEHLTMGVDVKESRLKMQELNIQDEAQHKAKPSKKSRERRRKLSNMVVQQPKRLVALAPDKSTEDEELKGSKSLQEEIEETQEEIEETQEVKDDNMSNTFGHFLKEFTEEGASAPFFEGQVKALNHCKSYVLNIKFKDLEKHDKGTATYVCNNMPRVHGRLNRCACAFLLKHDEFKTKRDEVMKKTTIEISDMPAPNSMRPFSKFALEHAMYRVWKLHDYGGKEVCATTFLGRKACLGYLNCILKKHKAGFSWNGSFSWDDFIVLDENSVFKFVIMKEASEDYSKEKAIADFNTFCVVFFRYFEAAEADEKYPAYFNQFQNDYMINMPDQKDTQAYDRWQEYMAHHFAFKAPQSISNLITETYEWGLIPPVLRCPNREDFPKELCRGLNQ